MESAYAVWTANRIRGRILVYCDRDLDITWPGTAATGIDMPPDPGERYVYASVIQNMVRAIYHIIPDPAWPEVERNLRTFPVFRYANGIFRLTVFDGVPLYITRAATMPHVGEKVLLHIGNRTWDDRNFSGILRLLKDRTLTSDIITIAGDAPAGRLEALQAYAHDR